MAVPPQSNEAFLREVDEELRRDQMVGLWRRYGRVGLGAVAAGLAALAGVLGWQHWQHSAAAAESEQLSQAYDMLGAGKVAEASKQLAPIAASGRPVYRALAQSVQADLALRDAAAGSPAKLKEAAAKFATIAQDTSAPQPLRDAALVRQTSAEFDSLSPDTVIARLSPLAVKGGAWLGSAGELIAIAQLQKGKPADARAMLQLIASDADVPDTIKQRAVQLSSAIENNALPKSSAPATEEPKTK